MTVVLTKHAVARYRERVRAVSLKQARRELENALKLAHKAHEPPEWAQRVRRDVDYYLVLGDVVMVVINNHVVTCLVRGTLSPHARRVRKERRHKQRARRKRLAGL